MQIRVKKFEELDVNELYNILRARSEVFVVEQNSLYLDCDGKDKYAYHLYIEIDGEIAAYLRILPKNISYAEASIGRVIVTPKFRGNGYARISMLHAFEFARENMNEQVFRISAQKYLTEFYKSLGFKQTSEEYLEDGIPHIQMLYG